jgi:hypothetical protein
VALLGNYQLGLSGGSSLNKRQHSSEVKVSSASILLNFIGEFKSILYWTLVQYTAR